MTLFCVGCGGGSRAPLRDADRIDVTLYRDAGFVRVRRRQAMASGVNEVEVGGVARTVVAGSPRLRVVGGEPARVVAAEHSIGEAGGDLLGGWIGQPVEVVSAGAVVAGRLVAVFPDRVVLATGDGAVRMVPRPAQVRGPAGAGAGQRLRWRLSASGPGPRDLEAVYAARGLEWRAGYSLVIDGGDVARATAGARRPAWLHGWLSISNQSGADLRAGRAVLSDRPFAREPDSPPVPASLLEAPPARRIALAEPLEIPAGGRLELPLVTGGALPVAAVMTAVFDPIGDRLDQPRRRPNPTRFYGATAIVEQPLDTYVEVELAAAGIAPSQLPPGDVVVLERSAGGRLTPLGQARAFHGSGVPSGTLRLAVGTATGLVGSRRVSEFSRDEAGRRLVEEVRIAIANRRGVPTEVLVREHLYRGLNWSLAYHNEVGALRKEAAQEIHFRVHLPGRATREIIYRVVYTW